MCTFHSTFDAIGDPRDFSAEAWRGSFTPDARALWERELGGTIQFRSGPRAWCALILGWAESGISLSYDRFDADDPGHNGSSVSAPAGALEPGLELLPNGQTVPRGSYLPMATAFAVVSEFLRAPKSRPTSISWVAADSLDWPEDY